MVAEGIRGRVNDDDGRYKNTFPGIPLNGHFKQNSFLIVLLCPPRSFRSTTSIPIDLVNSDAPEFAFEASKAATSVYTKNPVMT